MKKLILSLSIISLCVCGTLTYNTNTIHADEITLNSKQKIGTLFITYLAACGITLSNTISNVAENVGNWLSNINSALFGDVENGLQEFPVNENGEVVIPTDYQALFNEGLDTLNLSDNESFIKDISSNTIHNCIGQTISGQLSSSITFNVYMETLNSILFEQTNLTGNKNYLSAVYYYPFYYEIPQGTIVKLSNKVDLSSSNILTGLYWANWQYYSTNSQTDYNTFLDNYVNNKYSSSTNGYLAQNLTNLSTSNKTFDNTYNIIVPKLQIELSKINQGSIYLPQRYTIANTLPNLLVNSNVQSNPSITGLFGNTNVINPSYANNDIALTIPNISTGATWDDLYSIPNQNDITKKDIESDYDDDDTIVLPYPNVLDNDLEDENATNIGGTIKFGIISLIAQFLANILTTLLSIPQFLKNIWEKIQSIDFTSILENIRDLVSDIYNALTRTYTIEDIQSITWINAITNFETTITDAINTMKSYYNNNINFFLTGIAHPQSNQLTIMVNNILTNSNLYWVVYAIMTYSLLRYFI